MPYNAAASPAGAAIVIKSSCWNTFWWIFSTLPLVLAAPYVICKAMCHLKINKNRDALPEKVVVITGASSGLGEALAHSFYRAGCKVVLAARREEELERVRTDLLETHSRVPTHPPVVMQLDLSDLNSLPDKVAKILQIFGHVDILVNNGGISVRSDIVSAAIDVDIKVMTVNYFGSVGMTKAVLPSMQQRGEGKIVFISSVQGKFAIPFRSAYAASKHALSAFTDSLRAEVHKDGIKVLTVSPGYINTAISLNALTSSGQSYGVTDPATATGVSPERASEDILKAVLSDEKDVILAPLYIKVVSMMRVLVPSLYFWVMQKRAVKLASAHENPFLPKDD